MGDMPEVQHTPVNGVKELDIRNVHLRMTVNIAVKESCISPLPEARCPCCKPPSFQLSMSSVHSGVA